ncbi:MAG: hypothetical protein OEP95_02050 [Myxococcales bacterium]|nr:hypothetical protein [Myxococcales bacterium]
MYLKMLMTSCAALALVLGSTAHAKVLNGTILCDTNGDRQIDAGVDVPLVGVVVNIDESGGAAVGTAATEGDGTYFFNLPNQQNVDYQLTLDGATLPADATFIIPASGSHEFNSSDGIEFTRDWLIDSELCREVETGGCWMTGGGHWREARGTPRHNFGGNVYPSCSPDPGEGGQWNHVRRRNGVHVLGQSVDVVRCGNVGGIPDGSTSPVTPFNFIEFEGEGRLTGQGNNRIPEQDVYFFARAEDRNEPGSGNDRYFIHAFTDPGDPEGSTVLLTDVDGDASTVDPVVISGGNLQLHASSCEE